MNSKWLSVATLAGLCAIAGLRGEDNVSQSGSAVVEAFYIGILRHDASDLISGTRLEHGLDFNLEAVFSPSVSLLGGQLRPAAGASINNAGDTSQIYAYGRWQRDFASGFFVATGVGGSLNNGYTQAVKPDRKALGSHLLFHLPLEIGFAFNRRNSLSIYFDHMSNADLAEPNEGLDDLGVRYGFRF